MRSPLRLALLLAVLAPLHAHAQLPGLSPGQGVYVTDEQTRLRAAPSTSSDVLASLERGRWLEVVQTGEALVVQGRSATWVQVRDPWAPDSDATFVTPTGGWVWGGLLLPVPAGLSPPSIANWERVVVRVDPHTRELDLDGGDGEAVAWATHFDPDREGTPRTLEIAEWMRLGTTPAKSWKLVGWRRLTRLAVIDLPDGVTWLQIEGQGNRRQSRVLLRPSLMDAPALDLDHDTGNGPSWRTTTLLMVDSDADGVDELTVLEVTSDAAGQAVERGLSRFALTTAGPQQLGEPLVRSALMPAPNLVLESIDVHARRGRARITLQVRSEAAGTEDTQVVVKSWGERAGGPSGLSRSSQVVTRAAVPALVPGRVAEVVLSAPLERGWARLAVEATIVPSTVESQLNDNRKLVVVELP
jgi:hypothetical protein